MPLFGDCKVVIEHCGLKSPIIFVDCKPLRSLLKHLSTLERICVVLDTPIPGRGYYEEVVQHYSFDHYMRESVLKPSEGGPSRAPIEYLAATYTDLTVEQFTAVVEKKTKRKDVPELLRKYESTRAMKKIYIAIDPAHYSPGFWVDTMN